MVETGGNCCMARTNYEQLKAERDHAKKQVDLFERKYKNFNTIWHSIYKRLDREIKSIKGKKKTTIKKSAVKENNDG